MTDDLLHRLAAATEGSRELDAEIFCRVEGTVFRRIEHGHKVCFLVEGVGHDVWTDLKHVPAYTASLDAALPGENIVETKLVIAGWYAVHLERHPNGAKEFSSGYCATEPLARRIAALKAKEQTDE